MTLHFQPQTTTHRGALDKEIKRSMKDGVISFPEAERFLKREPRSGWSLG